MKNVLFVLLFLISSLAVAQTNRFAEPEDTTADSPTGGPGDNSENGDLEGDDPVPIDDYIPFLVITAVGFIIYQGSRKKENA